MEELRFVDVGEGVLHGEEAFDILGVVEGEEIDLGLDNGIVLEPAAHGAMIGGLAGDMAEAVWYPALEGFEGGGGELGVGAADEDAAGPADAFPGVLGAGAGEPVLGESGGFAGSEGAEEETVEAIGVEESLDSRGCGIVEGLAGFVGVGVHLWAFVLSVAGGAGAGYCRMLL